MIVFDADTGAFKRMWGAFGSVPVDPPNMLANARTPARARGTAPPGEGAARGGRGNQQALDTEGPGAPQFNGPVHSARVSNDGMVYVVDRSGRRVQVFTVDGTYVSQVFINRAGPSGGSACGLALSADPEQRFLYVADYGNSHMVVLDRKTLDILYQFGTRSANPGDFQGVHHMAVDSKGNLYTAEVEPGNRWQRFLFKGLPATLPPNALTSAQLVAQN